MTKLKIDAYRTASGTQGYCQGRLRGALTSQEIAKYVEYCLKPGKAPGPDKCPNELFKTMSDEEFLIVQAWVNLDIDSTRESHRHRAPESVHHEWHHLSTPHDDDCFYYCKK